MKIEITSFIYCFLTHISWVFQGVGIGQLLSASFPHPSFVEALGSSINFTDLFHNQVGLASKDLTASTESGLNTKISKRKLYDFLYNESKGIRPKKGDIIEKNRGLQTLLQVVKERGIKDALQRELTHNHNYIYRPRLIRRISPWTFLSPETYRRTLLKHNTELQNKNDWLMKSKVQSQQTPEPKTILKIKLIDLEVENVPAIKNGKATVQNITETGLPDSEKTRAWKSLGKCLSNDDNLMGDECDILPACFFLPDSDLQKRNAYTDFTDHDSNHSTISVRDPFAGDFIDYYKGKVDVISVVPPIFKGKVEDIYDQLGFYSEEDESRFVDSQPPLSPFTDLSEKAIWWS